MEGSIEEVKKILAGAKDAFFLALLAGYASDTVVEKEKKDGYKTITWTGGEYKVVDRYCVSPLDQSAGTTTIYYRDEPVWWMSYGGWYDKNAISFLKKALAKCYEARYFLGGRGPQKFEEDGFVYVNSVAKNDFFDFSGEERVFGKGLSCGHKYWGMSLI